MVNVADMTHSKERGLIEVNVFFKWKNPYRRKIFCQEFKYYSKQRNNNDSCFISGLTVMNKRRKLLKAKDKWLRREVYKNPS